jgi:hypothetical protein
LRFEVYLPPDLAEWLLDLIEPTAVLARPGLVDGVGQEICRHSSPRCEPGGCKEE